ncbi:hypothetical protein ACQSMD_27320 [Streptomyces flavovirens]|uniref:hypothetical protein n=1 Tax=Streptomyces TaxID=1883 RepID=UPI00114C98AE|nr:hypothetical protein [Streptomyces sp. BpilaLS-43]
MHTACNPTPSCPIFPGRIGDPQEVNPVLRSTEPSLPRFRVGEGQELKISDSFHPGEQFLHATEDAYEPGIGDLQLSSHQTDGEGTVEWGRLGFAEQKRPSKCLPPRNDIKVAHLVPQPSDVQGRAASDQQIVGWQAQLSQEAELLGAQPFRHQGSPLQIAAGIPEWGRPLSTAPIVAASE